MSDYVAIYKKSMHDKSVAEMRYQAALLSYNAAVTAQEDPEVIDRYRAEIHALVDIILDNISMVCYCTNKMQEL